MRILAEGTTAVGAAATRVIPNGTSAGQLPTGTRVVGLMVRAQDAAGNSAAIKVGQANPQHYVGSTDTKGFIMPYDGAAGDIMMTGTQNDVLCWTAYG